MQSFESSNGFFPFNAYLYPPTSDIGFASVASSSILEPAAAQFEFNTSFPSHPQQHHPSAYYPDNFLPPQGFSSSSIPVVVPSEVGQCYPSAYFPCNLPLRRFSVEHPQVTPQSPPDNTRRRRSSVKPNSKPSVRKTRVRNRERLGEEGRIELLQGDEYIMSFGATWVTCSGCMKRIKLDSRNRARYYPGFWLKHKGICQGVTAKMVRILSFFQKICVLNLFNPHRIIDRCKAQGGRRRDVIFFLASYIVCSITVRCNRDAIYPLYGHERVNTHPGGLSEE